MATPFTARELEFLEAAAEVSDDRQAAFARGYELCTVLLTVHMQEEQG